MSGVPAESEARRAWLARSVRAGLVGAGALGGLATGLMGGCAGLPGAARPGGPADPDAPGGEAGGAGASAGQPAEAPPDAARWSLELAQLPESLGRPGPLPREFRGAWVASVDHIDWPARPGLTTAQQRDDANRLLDQAAALGLNALLLQVRPAADALYPSAIEPWSEYLTGEQGRAPDEPWDPLAFWIEGAHRRGLELHAWFNPYRARHPSARGPLAQSHVAQRRPDLVRSYGDLLWMDPAEPDAAAQTLGVIADVLDRYAVDGIHIDDYFYPYPVKDASGAGEQPFPDEPAWARYQAGGGRLRRADWRRAQVDGLVQALAQLVRERRPGVRFGISPFGLPQPALRPPGISGFSQYDKLYADVERWLREGWMDYCAPQLYWPIGQPAQAFGVLADTWMRLNPRGLAMWPGLFTSRVGAPQRPWKADEVLDQIGLLRQRAGPGGVGGHIHFSLVALAQDRDGLAQRLRQGPYAEPAVVPLARSGAGGVTAPPPPRLAGTTDGTVAGTLWIDAAEAARTGSALPAPGALAVRQWAVWRRAAGQWRLSLQPAAEHRLRLDGAEALVVQALGAGGRASTGRVWWPGAPPDAGGAAAARRG